MEIIQLMIMKKKFILLSFTLFFPIISLAQGFFISGDNARTVAQNFYFERIQPHRPVNMDNIKITGTFTVEENREILYYIFNMSTGGFVAVSAFKATPAVLCYSFSGKYEPGNQVRFQWILWNKSLYSPQRRVSFCIAVKTTSQLFEANSLHLA